MAWLNSPFFGASGLQGFLFLAGTACSFAVPKGYSVLVFFRGSREEEEGGCVLFDCSGAELSRAELSWAGRLKARRIYCWRLRKSAT